MQRATYVVIATMLFSTCWQIACAGEPDGVVDKVQGSEINIKPEFHFFPDIGDKIEIFVKDPNVGEAKLGTAIVTGFDDERVHARVEKATKKIEHGQIVRALSVAPAARPVEAGSPSLPGAPAAEINGSVSKVEGQTITIRSTSDLLPVVGDKLTVSVEVPGVGKAKVASATISIVDGDVIRATIGETTGAVIAGQIVTIQSPNPVRRAGVAVPTLIGQTAGNAKSAVEKAGLVASFQMGVAPPANVQPHSVYAQDPKPGTKAAKGSTVLLTLYGKRSDPDEGMTGLQRWGEVVDPDGDCTVREKDGKLVVDLPAGTHDIYFGKGCNAPRVMQEVDGDFVAQVKVTAGWGTGVPASTDYYHGAGLLVWDSQQHYLRMERNLFYSTRVGDTIRYITPLYDRDEKRVNGWKSSRMEFFRGKSTWLRIQRSGKRFATSISHDGNQWTTTAVLTTEFPDKIQVGVHAICASPGDFAAEFADFTLTRGQPEPMAEASSIPIEGWGEIIDPDDDFTISAAPDRIAVTVPAGPYDLWYGEKDPAKRFNGLRVLREVEGDFVAHVRVNSDWQLGETLANGRNAMAAGLLVWDSQNQYLRHERNVFISRNQPGRVYSYVTPVYDRNETRLSEWKAVDPGFFKDPRSTWLMIQRTGEKIHAWISHDGKQWTHTGTHISHFPDKIQVGVHVINATERQPGVSFEEFRIKKG